MDFLQRLPGPDTNGLFRSNQDPIVLSNTRELFQGEGYEQFKNLRLHGVNDSGPPESLKLCQAIFKVLDIGQSICRQTFK